MPRKIKAKKTEVREASPTWERVALAFSAAFFLLSFIKYFFGYDARWLNGVIDFSSPIGILGLGFVFMARGLKALVRRHLVFRNTKFSGGQARAAGLVMLFASGIFLGLGIRTLVWFVAHVR